MVERAHVWVSGRVQGVGFRAYAARAAERHGVDGWVRNTADGRVEAVFEGPRDRVEAMVAWCRSGSPVASVSDVAVTWEDAQQERGFVVRR